MTHPRHDHRRPPAPRLADDEGAILVEMALILPVLILLLMGVFELGIMWRDQLTITAALRGAARVDAQLGATSTCAVAPCPNKFADKNALTSLNASISKYNNAALQKVVVWNATSSSNKVTPNSCKTTVTNNASGAGVAGLCNVYSATQVATAQSSTQFQDTVNNCGAGWDHWWCPTTRNNSLASGLDWLGMYTNVQYNTVTNALPATMSVMTLQDSVTMRIEPSTS